MANNTYNFNALKAAVTHVLGGAPDSNLSADQVVNGALAQLCNLNPWQWRQKPLSLASVANQSYIALPSDFQEFQVVKKAGDVTGCSEPVTLDRITEMRNSGVTTLGYGGLAYCLNTTPQTSSTVEPTQIIEVYPTPTTLVNPYVVGSYLRQIPKLSGSTDLPDIPSTYHELLLIWCRAYAVMLETGQFGADYQMFTNMLPQYERLDGRSSGYIGKMRGGLARAAFGAALPVGIGPIGGP